MKVLLHAGNTAFGNINNQLDQVLAGVMDVALGLHGIPRGRFPRTGIIDMPFLTTSAEQASRILWTLYPELLKDEYRGVKVLSLFAHNPGVIHTRAQKVEKMEDLKGLRIINTEVDRIVDLVNQLLDVSRLETQRLQLNLEPVDLVALAQEAVERLQTTTDRHTLRLRAPEAPLWVEGDAMRLAQVLGNLITNAIKYSPNGGPVEITLESHEGRGWVSVRDWGVGIAPEDQAHLFRRFYRGSRRAGGTLGGMGLGLYISREIIQRHRGDIVFHSQPGQGTTFLFWLPLARPEPVESGSPGG